MGPGRERVDVGTATCASKADTAEAACATVELYSSTSRSAGVDRMDMACGCSGYDGFAERQTILTGVGVDKADRAAGTTDDNFSQASTTSTVGCVETSTQC